jgi:hypothetical protein
MTIDAQFIYERCEGTTPEELSSRSKTLRHGLRRLRTMERDLLKGTVTPHQLQNAWSKMIETSSRMYRKDFHLRPNISSLEEELGYVEDELKLPWDKDGAFGFEHHCHLEVHGEVIDMGVYRIDLITRNVGGCPYVRIYPLKDCFCGFTGTLHPHVSDGQLCMGELRQILYNAWQSRNIQSIVDMIRTTLDTYNPGSPYQTIEKWLEHDCYCNKCHRFIPTDERRTINPHGMPRELRGAWDECLTFDRRSEHHPFYGKDFHVRTRRVNNYPDGTFRDVVVCDRCFRDMKDYAFRHALREAASNFASDIRRRRINRSD